MADAHPDLDRIVELLDGAGQQFVWKPSREPSAATLRLMATLGVKVEPVSSTGTFVPVYCPRPGCGWSSYRGGPPGRRDLETHERVMHGGGSLDTSDGMAALEAMDRGERQPRALTEPDQGRGESRSEATPVTASESSGSVSAPAIEVAKQEVDTARDTNARQKAPTGPVEPKREDTIVDTTPPSKWTRPSILEAFRRFHRERGRWPLASDTSPLLPSRKALNRQFKGGWQEAWDAVGAGTIPRANAARAYAHGPAKRPTKPSGRGPAKPRKTVEPNASVPVEARPELLQEPEPAAGTAALAPRPDDLPGIPLRLESPPGWSLALTGDFARDARRVRDQAALMHRQAEALGLIALGIDKLAEADT